jgi:hypothetical protein
MKKFLVVGHPRSGTGYMAMLLQAYGFDVGHERLLADGISSWMCAVDTKYVPYGDAKNGAEFEHVLHVVRHPVKTVASMAGGILLQTRPPALKYMSSYIDTQGGNEIETAVRTYVEWNTMIDSLKPSARFKVEHAHLELPKFLTRVGLECALDRTKAPARDYNSRLHRQLRWVDVSRAVRDRRLYNELKRLAVVYEYAQR